MTSSDPLLILDISSDEEPDFGGGGVVGFGDRDDQNWLSELLGEVDRNNNKLDIPNYDDNSDDDVVVLGEFFPKPKRKSRLQSLKVDVDDGDCMILDGNPEKTVMLENGGNDDDDSDDLVIVGEKGEVACRDFPHSRHLCVKFPFASTPHNLHCSQCHCYVCDTLAPCTHWGTSIDSVDHCHASDKEEYWRTERKSSKQGGDKPIRVPLTTSNASFVSGVHQMTQLPASTPPNPNSLLPTQGIGQVTMRSCSTSYNTSVPNVINQGRLHTVGGGNLPRNISHVPAVSPRSHTAFKSNVSINNRSSNAENRSSRIAPIRVVLKKTGASPNNIRGQSCNVENRSSRLSSTSAVLKRTESTGASPRGQSCNVVNRSSGLSSTSAVLKRTESTGASPNNIRGQSCNVVNRSSGLSSTSTGASPNNIRGQSCNAVNRSSGLSSTSAVLKRTESTGASPNNIRGQSCNVENKSSRLSSTSAALLKMKEFSGASSNNRRLNERSYTQSQLPRDPLPKRFRAIQTPTYDFQDSIRQNIRTRVANSVTYQRKLSALPRINVRCAKNVSSQPISVSQVRDSATLPQINSSSHPSRNSGNAVSFEPQVTSQPPPDLVFQPTGSISSQNFLSSQSNTSKILLNQHSRSITSSSHNTGNTFENQSSNPLAYDQNNFQEGIQTASDPDMDSIVFDFEWANLQAPPTSIPQVENASNLSLLDNLDSHFPVTTNPDTLDFQFESWLFENQSLPEASVGPVSPHWSVLSPEPSSIDDAGTLFDVEVKTQ